MWIFGFKSPSSVSHLVVINIFIFLYSWVRNSSFIEVIWKFKKKKNYASPKWTKGQTVEHWKYCSMKIDSIPIQAQKLCAVLADCICYQAQCFPLLAVKHNWEGNVETHNFAFTVQLFSHSWIRWEQWDYLQFGYYLECDLCNWSYNSYLFSLRPNNSKTIKKVSVLCHQPCQWESPGDDSQMSFHMIFILQAYFLAKKKNPKTKKHKQ